MDQNVNLIPSLRRRLPGLTSQSSGKILTLHASNVSCLDRGRKPTYPVNY